MTDSITKRDKLLPPYMLETQAWPDLVTAIDAVFNPAIDNPTAWLGTLRDAWNLTTASETALKDASQIIASTQFEEVEKNILVRQANMLGFDLTDSDLLTSDDYQRIVRSLPLYWYSKGTPGLQDFLGFVFNSIFSIVYLWSTPGVDYGTYGPFLPEGDPGIGTAVWDGGDWFPTTHVQVEFDPFKFGDISEAKLRGLFYALANYNLVLQSIIRTGSVFIHSADETELARMMMAVPLDEHTEHIPSVGEGDPVNTVAPAVTGTPNVGQVLTTDNGTWTNSPLFYAYQWYVNSVAVPGETASTYTVLAGDLGYSVYATVVATNITLDSSLETASNSVVIV